MTWRRRSSGDRPARFWQDVARNWTHSSITASSIASILAFEAPAAGTLTSLPPEDVTILRVVGDYSLIMSGVGNWTLGLMMVDPGWTPALVASSGFQVDADKRVLWHRSHDTTLASSLAGYTDSNWYPPGHHLIRATANLLCSADGMTHIDIQPKVKLEAGKSLSLVAWENGGTGTLTTTSLDMRVLFQRSRRR